MQALAQKRVFIPTQREGSTVTVQVVGDIVRKPADGSGGWVMVYENPER